MPFKGDPVTNNTELAYSVNAMFDEEGLRLTTTTKKQSNNGSGFGCAFFLHVVKETLLRQFLVWHFHVRSKF